MCAYRVQGNGIFLPWPQTDKPTLDSQPVCLVLHFHSPFYSPVWTDLHSGGGECISNESEMEQCVKQGKRTRMDSSLTFPPFRKDLNYPFL